MHGHGREVAGRCPFWEARLGAYLRRHGATCGIRWVRVHVSVVGGCGRRAGGMAGVGVDEGSLRMGGQWRAVVSWLAGIGKV